MRGKKAVVLLIITAFLMMMAVGCGDDKTKTPQKEEKPLTVGLSFFGSNLDPHAEYNGWYIMEFGMGETLLKTSKGMKLEPWLAESWENVDDNTWKIKIRDNVKFHNGKKVDGAAVKASLSTIEINKCTGLGYRHRAEETRSLSKTTSQTRPLLHHWLILCYYR